MEEDPDASESDAPRPTSLDPDPRPLDPFRAAAGSIPCASPAASLDLHLAY